MPSATFQSPFPPIKPPRQSWYTYLMEQDIYHPDRAFAYNGQTGEMLTRGQLKQQALELAYKLRNVEMAGMEGLSRGSTIVWYSPTTLYYPVVMFATAAAGIVCAYVNSAWQESELAHAYKISIASHVLVHPSLLQIVINTLTGQLGMSKEEAKKRVIIAAPDNEIPRQVLNEGWLGLDRFSARVTCQLPERFDGPKADDTAAVFFSSGTTGLSKAVEVTHDNVASGLHASRSISTYFTEARDTILSVVPMFHVLGASLVTLQPFQRGTPIVYLPRFDPELALACIEKYSVGSMITVPPILHFLTNHPLVDKYDLSSLKIMAVGAAPVIPSMMEQCEERFAKRGYSLKIAQGWGMTEVAGFGTYMPLDKFHNHKSTIGCLLPSMEGRVVDDDEKDVPLGQPGELWVRGPCVMKGYTNNPKATAETITPDGWLKTGDVAIIDEEGYITIADRKKELIKYKGFQVPPAELESVLNDHPAVLDSAVLGVWSDEQATEFPKAYIVPRDPNVLKQTDHTQFTTAIVSWLHERVAHYKQLRGGIVVIDAIPRTVSGKILKRELRELEKKPKAKL